MANGIQRVLRKYPLYFLAWTFVGLFFFSQGLAQKLISGDPTPWWHHLSSWMVGVYLWALITPLVLWLAHRFPIERKRWFWPVLIHLLLSGAVTIVQLAVESAILSRMGIFPTIMRGFVSTYIFLLMIGFHGGVAMYWTVLGIRYGLDYYNRYQERAKQALRLELNTAELKTQLMNAQLSALKMQLQPHFLFNTLNAIMVLVRQQKSAQAEEMLSRLSDLLRLVLEDVEAQEVPLRRELEYLQLYLSIEQVRFQDRLRVEISSDPAIQDAAVPQMGLQPIVENAIRHGIGKSSTAGKIKITAARVNDTLEIQVRDDGPGVDAKSLSNGHGIGLSNTLARLHQLYAGAAKLAVENAPSGGAQVTMVLPYRLAPATSEKEVMEIHALHDVNR